MPSNAKQCQAMPSNAKQCQAMPSNAKQCQAMPSNAKQCQAMPSNAKQCQAMPSNAKQCQAMPSNAKQCQAMPSNAKQCQAMPSNAKQCQAMPSNAKQPDPDPVDFGWNCGSTTCQRSRLRARQRRQWRQWRHLSYLVVPRLKTRKVLMEWYIWRTSCRASIRSQACTIPFSMVCTPVLCSTFERCCAHRYNMLQPLKSLNAQVKVNVNIFAIFSPCSSVSMVMLQVIEGQES